MITGYSDHPAAANAGAREAANSQAMPHTPGMVAIPNARDIAERKAAEAAMKEAKEMKDKLIADAREKAGEEAKKLVAAARESIQAEKKAAIDDLKSQMATLSVDIAEKILKVKLEDSKAQRELVDRLVSDAELN